MIRNCFSSLLRRKFAQSANIFKFSFVRSALAVRGFHSTFPINKQSFTQSILLRSAQGIRELSTEVDTKKFDVSAIKTELGSMIAKEVEQLNDLGGKELYDDYVKRTNSTVSINNGIISVTSAVKGYDVKISFSEAESEDGGEEDPDEDVEEKEEDVEEKEEEDEEEKVKKHHFTMDIKPQEKEGPVLRFHSIAGRDDKLYFDAIEFFSNKKDSESDVGKSDLMDFDDLNPDIQDKLCDLLDALLLDDSVAKFVHVARHESLRQSLLGRLNKLDQFIK